MSKIFKISKIGKGWNEDGVTLQIYDDILGIFMKKRP